MKAAVSSLYITPHPHPIGYSDFNNLMGLASKNLPIKTRKNAWQALLKVFQRNKPYLAICISEIKNYPVAHWNKKIAQFYADFKSIWRNRKKLHLQKVICQKQLPNSSTSGKNSHFTTHEQLFCFFSTFSNQHTILSFIDFSSQILWRKRFKVV